VLVVGGEEVEQAATGDEIDTDNSSSHAESHWCEQRWWHEAIIVEHGEAQLLHLLVQIADHVHGAAAQPTMKCARREMAEKSCVRGTSAFHWFLGGAYPVS